MTCGSPVDLKAQGVGSKAVDTMVSNPEDDVVETAPLDGSTYCSTAARSPTPEILLRAPLQCVVTHVHIAARHWPCALHDSSGGSRRSSWRSWT